MAQSPNDPAPKPDAAPAAARQRPTAVRRAFADGPFGQIHYRFAAPRKRGGSGGVPLLMLHMSPKSGWIYRRLVAAMGCDRPAFAPDTPGFGESDPPPRPPQIADYAAALLAFVEAMEKAEQIAAGPVDVLGYHTGAMIAVEMARMRPSAVRRLALISAPILTPAERAQFKAAMAPPAIDPDGAWLVAKWRQLLAYAEPGLPLDLAARSFAENLRAAPDRVGWGHDAAFAYDLAAALPQIAQPIM
ncbi:MAG: alpha/beta fold hydrolase, partial [Alphaproteobacteria bacterium]